jgi:hypothetical protein
MDSPAVEESQARRCGDDQKGETTMKFKNDRQRKAVMAKIKNLPTTNKVIEFEVEKNLAFDDKVKGHSGVVWLGMNGYGITTNVVRVRKIGIGKDTEAPLKTLKRSVEVVKKPETAYRKFTQSKKIVNKLVDAEPATFSRRRR